ncbi:MAG: cytochrome c [Isosphaeraceae bacterium]
MKKLMCVACMVGLVAISGLLTSPGRADEEKTATIKEVMQKLHKGANSPLAKVKKALAADSPDWKEIQKSTKAFATLGADLAKNQPTKGEKEDYKKLADSYADNAKALNDAAKKEDREAAQSAFKKVSTSCMACHKAHKPD